MRIFDYSKKAVFETGELPETSRKSRELFVLCSTHELVGLKDVFGFDESTVMNCTDLDESVRYACFNGYDFVSMVHIEFADTDFLPREINLYVSLRYLVLVMPDHDSTLLSGIEKKLFDYAKLIMDKTEKINKLYYWILHNLLSDFSNTLETLEDWMQALSEEIISKVDKAQFEKINSHRNMAYAMKKQLRALTYLGEQILIDENKLILKNQLQQFKSIDTRLKKLYDFADSLYNLATEMTYTYDSRLAIKTNDTINKLTAVTLFFGPLTVITGIYGMNFDVMPELRWAFGYPFILIVMAMVSLVLFYILKKNKWM